MSNALETSGLGKRYGRTWALQDCTLSLPTGRVAALVGPNGAGKTTLLHLILGLLKPTEGSVQVFGSSPYMQPTETLPHLGFVAQDHPLYRNFTVGEMLKLGQKVNPCWDDQMAHTRIQKLGVPLDRRTGKLSGGQQAQVALVLALAKRPRLLVLDEPLASLDPLARREFLRTLMEAVTETETTVLLSSHIINDLERVCDHLIVLSASRVQVSGDIQQVLQEHIWLVGPRQDVTAISNIHTIIESHHTERQTTLLVHTNGQIFDPVWETRAVSLEDLVLAYLGQQVEERSSLLTLAANESTKREGIL
jgi:ABC-2 type transport system ATP-binding protein